MIDNEKNIQDRFQKLMERTETDPKLKEEVFDTITLLESIASVVDLFSTKFVYSETKFIDDILPRDK